MVYLQRRVSSITDLPVAPGVSDQVRGKRLEAVTDYESGMTFHVDLTVEEAAEFFVGQAINIRIGSAR